MVGALTLGISPLSMAEKLMQWQRIPLPIDLHVNQERILFLDKNVQVGLPPELDGKIEVQSMGGAVYLKAKAPFDLSRVQLRDIESGQIVLLDLKSRESQSVLEAVRIVFEDSVANNQEKIAQTSVTDEDNDLGKVQSALPIPAALVRYAAQSLYAPLRTVEPLAGVRRVALKLPKSLPTLIPNLPLYATPLESWGLADYVVTAVRLRNATAHKLTLDPRYLQGHFYAAAFQHSWLGEAGTPEDTTVVYLVTQGEVSKAIIPSSLVKQRGKK